MTPFERIVEALILTAIVLPIVAAIRVFLCWLGTMGWTVGAWTTTIAFARVEMRGVDRP